MTSLDRRNFLRLGAASLAAATIPALAQSTSTDLPKLGVVAKVVGKGTVEETIKHVNELGFTTCQIYLDALNLGQVKPLQAALKKYGVTVSAISEHNPGPRVFDFDRGPSTIGLVPSEYRRERIAALKLAADFANACDVDAIHSHLGFIPEEPTSPAYEAAVAAIREVAEYCKPKGVMLLAETGEETPITLLRTIQDVGTGNFFVNLDTANLILYGKGNPVDAMDVFGKYVRGTHMKDGLFPTNPHKLGEEVAIGKGRVDFPELFRRLHAVNYRRTITIEREISGPQQTADILASKVYLQRLIETNYGKG
ncbi:sugar phosphate isomerase/epimerase family protein [Terriglobus roseus]|uniref:Sugar phosphate isomerase/epimerase n=1 Tax=Terriglobus roseus TaxID=392734 RepID=A0A1G7H6K3_9BACT|nr:sugar phosphate isomerase/epimerase family protein [Terriglobus roseus]SDE96070.1 Sugar phosphate isomerase/epimerase [Terriglobus roseus]